MTKETYQKSIELHSQIEDLESFIDYSNKSGNPIRLVIYDKSYRVFEPIHSAILNLLESHLARLKIEFEKL